MLIGPVVAAMLPAAPVLELKLAIFGENSCSRWHQDNYIGRAIVSYTGRSGTDYTRDSNVDFWELHNCGNNDCVIRDANQCFAVGLGDIMLIKGTKYPSYLNSGQGGGLVH